MAASPIGPSSPWHGAGDAPDWTDSFQALDRGGAGTPADSRGKETDIMEDGLVCVLFDD